MPPYVYKHAGKRVPSVTTITSRYSDQSALMYWANLIGLGEHAACDHQEACAVCGRKKGLRKDEVKAAASIGSLAHDLIQRFITTESGGEWDFDWEPYKILTDEDIAQSEFCLEQMQDWWGRNDVEVLAMEEPLVSAKYKFGGRFDAIAMVSGKFATLDWKTGNLYPEHWSQQGGYNILIEEHQIGVVEENHLFRMNRDEGGWDHKMRPRKTMEFAMKHFLHIRELYEMDKRMKKLC